MKGLHCSCRIALLCNGAAQVVHLLYLILAIGRLLHSRWPGVPGDRLCSQMTDAWYCLWLIIDLLLLCRGMAVRRSFLQMQLGCHSKVGCAPAAHWWLGIIQQEF